MRAVYEFKLLKAIPQKTQLYTRCKLLKSPPKKIMAVYEIDMKNRLKEGMAVYEIGIVGIAQKNEPVYEINLK